MAIRKNEIKLIPGQRNDVSLSELKFGDGSVMSLRDLFGKRFDGSVIRKEFDLINKPVQGFVRRDFIYLSRSFYVSSVLTENKHIDQSRLELFESSLGEVFVEVQSLVRKRISEINKLLKNNGVNDEEVHTPRPMHYIVPIIHPRAYQYMGLLREVDELHSLREHAWLLQIIDHKQRNENFRDVMKAVRRIGSVTRMSRIAMWKMLQKAAAEATGAEGEDLKKFAEEQSQTLVVERNLDPTSAGHVSAEASLPAIVGEAAHALPAEVSEKSSEPDEVAVAG